MNINHIYQGQKIIINGREYIALAKVLYGVVDGDYRYAKVFLNDGGLLGYDMEKPDTISYFGELIAPIDIDVKNAPDKIIYNGREYSKDGDVQYERVIEIEFGDFEDSEGECWWGNYSAADGSWISPGLIARDHSRSDYFGRDMTEYEIKFL
ncbi:MAG: hypothetical protein LBR41_03330 [Rickettsiales bacterium]|jgi:hypothetical protein|nr:hypothetical protein [Rickettsiales bacterium]